MANCQSPEFYSQIPPRGGHVGRLVVVPLRCHCGALTNHRAQVECVTGRTAPPRPLCSLQVSYGWIWPFGVLAALQLGALQQQLIAARKLDLCRCSIGLMNAGTLGSLLGAHERKVDIT
jgi:hypothetical protein